MTRSIMVLLLTTLLASCSTELNKTTSEEFRQAIQGRAQGTTWSIVYYDLQERDLTPQVDSLLKAIDASVSTYLQGSTIDRWNKSDSGTVVDPLFLELLLQSYEIYTLTEGAFDPTVKPLVSFWGFGPERIAHPEQVDSASIDSLLELVNLDTLRIRRKGGVVSLDEFGSKDGVKGQDDFFLFKPLPGMQLDFNAIGQGWSADKIAEFLQSKGLKLFFVEIGGEIVAGNPKPDGEHWKFGIDKPEDGNYERTLQAIIKLRNRGMATSGNYRKFYEKDGLRYSHTIDPKSGYPVQHNLLSTTVLSATAGKADALATAFMVMGTDSTIQFLNERNYTGSYVYLISDDLKGGYSTYLSKEMIGMVEELKE